MFTWINIKKVLKDTKESKNNDLKSKEKNGRRSKQGVRETFHRVPFYTYRHNSYWEIERIKLSCYLERNWKYRII